MYTLRIINQALVGAEKRRNILFDGEYSILMKIPLGKEERENVKEGQNCFENALDEFHKNNQSVGDPTIIGLVYINDATYPIHNYQVVYIVSDEGKTAERVYGMYEKK